MTADQFKALMARIEVTWSMKFDDLKREVYAEGLGDLDYSGAELAVKKLAQTLKFAPSIAEIREVYASIIHGDIPTLPDIMCAVRVFVSRFGGWRYDEGVRQAGHVYLEAQPPIVRELIKGMGWSNLCGANWEFLQGRIKDFYIASADELRTSRQLSPKLVERIAQLRGEVQASALAALTDGEGGDYE